MTSTQHKILRGLHDLLWFHQLKWFCSEIHYSWTWGETKDAAQEVGLHSHQRLSEVHTGISWMLEPGGMLALLYNPFMLLWGKLRPEGEGGGEGWGREEGGGGRRGEIQEDLVTYTSKFVGKLVFSACCLWLQTPTSKSRILNPGCIFELKNIHDSLKMGLCIDIFFKSLFIKI